MPDPDEQETIKIELTPDMWTRRQQWVAEAALRQRRDAHQERLRRTFTDAENSVIIPAGNVWVIHGVVEYGQFSPEEVEADWPDEAIWRDNPPVPVIAWRVARSQVQEFEPGHQPEMILFDGEYQRTFTDLAFGSTPAEAVAQARRNLIADRDDWKMRTERCAAKGHQRATIYQSSPLTCECTERRVEFIQGDQTDG